MTDFLELPHWAQRSQALWRFLAKRWLLHVKNTAAFEGDAPGARLWLSAFAPLSWPYRVVLMAWLALLRASMHPMLGLAAVGFGAVDLAVAATSLEGSALCAERA